MRESEAGGLHRRSVAKLEHQRRTASIFGEGCPKELVFVRGHEGRAQEWWNKRIVNEKSKNRGSRIDIARRATRR